mmetsp:Transcript_72047/g.201100  ORF Transcript_72047/g.201100 Transcript_72047/m.201100 type:complete len:262 (+) Transcript_72047:202-987(+)
MILHIAPGTASAWNAASQQWVASSIETEGGLDGISSSSCLGPPSASLLGSHHVAPQLFVLALGHVIRVRHVGPAEQHRDAPLAFATGGVRQLVAEVLHEFLCVVMPNSVFHLDELVADLDVLQWIVIVPTLDATEIRELTDRDWACASGVQFPAHGLGQRDIQLCRELKVVQARIVLPLQPLWPLEPQAHDARPLGFGKFLLQALRELARIAAPQDIVDLEDLVTGDHHVIGVVLVEDASGSQAPDHVDCYRKLVVTSVQL